MGEINRALLAVAGTLLLALALSNAPDSAALGAALVIATLALAVHTVANFTVGRLTIGRRAIAHAESLSETPAPSHPSTAGLPLTRAPAGATAAA